MKFSSCILFAFTCGYLSFCVYGINLEDDTSSRSKSYFDFLQGVSTRVTHVRDRENLQHMKQVNDRMYRLYQPVQEHVTRLRGVENDCAITDKHYSLSSFPIPAQSYKDKIDNLLYTILSSLQRTLRENENLTSTCVNDTGRLIIHLLSGSSWAIQFFDATGKPGPSLTEYHFTFVGNYDQCRNATAPPGQGTNEKGFKGNYCNVGFQNPATLGFVGLGACLPSTCSSGEITSLTRDILRAINASSIPVDAVTAECRTAPTKVTTATIFSIIILCVIGSMVIVGTFFDLVNIRMKENRSLPLNKDSDDSIRRDNNGYQRFGNNGHVDEPPAYSETLPASSKTDAHKGSDTVLAKVLIAFSVYSNGKKLLNTSQAPGSLGAIHGIRFLSMSWVVLCHTLGQILSVALNTSTFFVEFINRWTSLAITNGFPSVDTFFTLSGLLTAYLTIKEMKRRNTWKINWPLFYFHRFWRLTPPYMFTLVIALGLTQYMGQGPFWANQQPVDRDFCQKNWWTNLLYVNNLVKPLEICFGHSWYLANDMQFFVISPLMLIPFYFHQMAGLLSCCVFLLAHMITTGALSTDAKWPLTMVSQNPAAAAWFTDYYVTPWCRIGPFIVGVIAGSVLAVTKGRPFRMPRWGVVLGWAVAVASGLAVVYGVKGDVTGEHTSSVAVEAAYNAVSRSVWGACVCWVIVACSAGYGGPVNALLSWSPFVFLGRLTYMSYLIHLTIVAILFNNMGSLIYINDITIVALYLGLLLFVNMLSFVAVLALESPMVGLEKALIRKERRD